MKEKYAHLVDEYGLGFVEYPAFMMYGKYCQTFTYKGFSVEELCKKNPECQVLLYQEFGDYLRAALVHKTVIADFFIKTLKHKDEATPINPYYLLIK